MSKTNIKTIISAVILIILLSGCSNKKTTTDIAYTFDDGSTITKQELLVPITLYNNICASGDATAFSKVYPPKVLDFFLVSSNQETSVEYAEMLYSLYTQVYGEEFNMTNTFIDCKLLTPNELNDFCQFHEENIDISIMPDYAFIVTSEYNISYLDKNGLSTTDSELDYYIAYFYENNMY